MMRAEKGSLLMDPSQWLIYAWDQRVADLGFGFSFIFLVGAELLTFILTYILTAAKTSNIPSGFTLIQAVLGH